MKVPKPKKPSIKMTETSLKSTIKDYLALKGIFSFPITQGLGSYRGVPDRMMFYKGKVHCLEIKLPTGKMSEYQMDFKVKCKQGGIPYHIIRCFEDIQLVIEGE